VLAQHGGNLWNAEVALELSSGDCGGVGGSEDRIGSAERARRGPSSCAIRLDDGFRYNDLDIGSVRYCDLGGRG